MVAKHHGGVQREIEERHELVFLVVSLGIVEDGFARVGELARFVKEKDILPAPVDVVVP